MSIWRGIGLSSSLSGTGKEKFSFVYLTCCMGNCQAAEASVATVQHPNDGKVEKLYWPVAASEVMKKNPGYYVALVTVYTMEDDGNEDYEKIRITRLKLIKPKELLLVGQVYRLVSSEDVMKALHARKLEKKKNNIGGSIEVQCCIEANLNSEKAEMTKQQQQRRSSSAVKSSSKHWRPSLQSISEGTL